MSLVRWDPFRDMDEMAERVNRYVGHPVLARSTDDRKENLGIPDWMPVVDIAETPTDYLVRVQEKDRKFHRSPCGRIRRRRLTSPPGQIQPSLFSAPWTR